MGVGQQDYAQHTSAGYAARMRCDWDVAIEQFALALAFAESAYGECSHQVVVTLELLAYCEDCRSLPTREVALAAAKRYLVRALAIADDYPEEKLSRYASLFEQATWTFRDLRELDLAQEYTDRAATLYACAGDHNGRWHALVQSTAIAQERQDFAKGLAVAETLRTFDLASRHPFDTYLVEIEVGECLLGLGQYERAEEIFVTLEKTIAEKHPRAAPKFFLQTSDLLARARARRPPPSRTGR